MSVWEKMQLKTSVEKRTFCSGWAIVPDCVMLNCIFVASVVVECCNCKIVFIMGGPSYCGMQDVVGGHDRNRRHLEKRNPLRQSTRGYSSDWWQANFCHSGRWCWGIRLNILSFASSTVWKESCKQKGRDVYICDASIEQLSRTLMPSMWKLHLQLQSFINICNDGEVTDI